MPIADPAVKDDPADPDLNMKPRLFAPTKEFDVTKTDAAKIDPKQAHVLAQWPAGRPIVCCRFDPKGRFLFCGLESPTIERFNLADGKKVSFPGGHDSWVFSLAFSPDGENAYSGGGEGGSSLGDRRPRTQTDPDDRGPPRLGARVGCQPRRNLARHRRQ